MGLKNYKPKRLDVSIGEDNVVQLRGLSLVDITVLVDHHLPDLEELFELFADINKQDDQQFETVVMSLLQRAPGLAANIIALGSDEPDDAKKAATLPAPLQIDMLLKIGTLTFEEVGGVKKGWESIAALLTKANAKSLTMKLSRKPGLSGST